MNSELETLNEINLKSGDRLVLRKPSEGDAFSMIKYLNAVGGESDNLLFGKDEFYLTVDKEAEYINKINSDSNALMLLGLIDGELVSVAQLGSLGRKRISHNSELAISVKKEYWGKGVGTAMMEELLRFAREHNVIRNVSLGVKADNTNAIRLYEKSGFRQVGIHKDYFNINGTYYDELIMDLNL
jgi:RimJ/RimL family protein N-acetyltransferase